jgi:hypothetical protein
VEHSSGTPNDLAAQWRERAALLREYGDGNTARLWLIAAKELEQAIQAAGEETLSLTDAARLSGFTADHLGQLVKRGKIRNAGRPGAPRIRRCDLPAKKTNGPGRPRRRAPVAREHIRTIANSYKGD